MRGPGEPNRASRRTRPRAVVVAFVALVASCRIRSCAIVAVVVVVVVVAWWSSQAVTAQIPDRRGAMQLPSDVWLQKQQRYIPIPKTLGVGSYGKVLQAVDAITQEQVALKKQKLPSESAAQELLAYRGLASFPSLHVQTLHDFFVVPPPSGSSGLSVLYLVYRVAETDLWCLWRSPDVQAGALPKS